MMLCGACSRKVLSRLPSDLRKYDVRSGYIACISAFSTTDWYRMSSSSTSKESSESKSSDASKPPSNSSETFKVKHAVAKSTSSSDLPSMHTGERVKQAGKDVFYTGIVLFGIGVTGLMGYAIFRELMSSKSPNGVYSAALKLCKKDVRVKSILGEPIKAYGDLSSLRGRRRHVQSAEFLDGDAHIVQLKFYISGPYNSACVYVEKDVSSSTYRNLIFETDDRRERFSLLAPVQSSLSSSLFS